MVLCGVHTGEQTVASIDYTNEREVQRMSFPLSLCSGLGYNTSHITNNSGETIMPIKVAVFNIKGGVGKTTVSVILTQIALMHNKKVLAIDQASL